MIGKRLVYINTYDYIKHYMTSAVCYVHDMKDMTYFKRIISAIYIRTTKVGIRVLGNASINIYIFKYLYSLRRSYKDILRNKKRLILYDRYGVWSIYTKANNIDLCTNSRKKITYLPYIYIYISYNLGTYILLYLNMI